jgi:hypothetical protein
MSISPITGPIFPIAALPVNATPTLVATFSRVSVYLLVGDDTV